VLCFAAVLNPVAQCALVLASAAANAADESRLPARWAFEPPQRQSVSQTAHDRIEPGFVRDPLDAFVVAKLAAVNLSPSAAADARTLLRRATFDVTGLPPSPAEAAEFAAEVAANGLDSAYERLVDRLLASPRYGERCASDWLDLVRFAETNGFEMNQPRPDAWPYRDWVIDAFNRDMPYADFVRAQLAGDRTGDDAATGFLVAGTWDQVKSPDPELTATQRDDELHGMVATTGAALLGITVGCAKCHDHKFDPIDQRDYYSLRACFEGVELGSRPWNRTDEAASGASRDAVIAARNVDRFDPIVASAIRFVVTATSDAEPCLDELEVFAVEAESNEAGSQRRNIALASAGAIVRASSVYAGNPRHKLEHLNDGRYGNDFSWIAAGPTGFVEVEFGAPTEVDTVIWGRDRLGAFRDRVATEYRIEALVDGAWRAVSDSSDRLPFAAMRSTAYAGRFNGSPPSTFRLDRGNPMAPREIVAPGGISSVGVPFPQIPEGDEPARRSALAEWIVAKENPLTARVIVNRIWQQHFGRGLVETPSDFGAMGAPPSHPELLDTLACDFVASDGRLKALHRRMLLSGTYRQASAPRGDALAVDAASRLLWRFAARRRTAESIRDSMLAVAGVLDLEMGGPSVSPFAPNDNYVRVYEPKTTFGPEDFRRSIYLMRVRMHPEPTFATFDLPDGGQPCPRRDTSVTPLQALTLTHSPFVLEIARRFAARLEREVPGSVEEQTRAGFQLAFGHEASESEFAAARAVAVEHGLPIVCRAWLGASEFAWTE
jgi:Protein of unknown function (DUF1553)/Protein of unknown function (DUF1549)